MRAKLALIWICSILPLSGAWAIEDSPEDVRPGDFYFVSMPCYACPLIEKTTGSPYSHVAIVESVVPEPTVVMAVEPVASRVRLKFLQDATRGRPQKLMRIKEGIFSPAELAQALARIVSFLGTPFDTHFLLGVDRLYCSELAYFAFLRRDGRPLFEPRPMHFAPYESEWETLLGHAPPEGQWGVSPGDLARSPWLVDIQH